MNNKKAQTGAVLDLLLPAIIIILVAVSFATIITGFGDNYGADSTGDTGYDSIRNKSDEIQAYSIRMNDALIGGNQTQTNVLDASTRLFTGAYNSILVFSNIPGLYQTIIVSTATSLGISSETASLIITAIGFAIAGTLLYLILGRR